MVCFWVPSGELRELAGRWFRPICFPFCRCPWQVQPSWPGLFGHAPLCVSNLHLSCHLCSVQTKVRNLVHRVVLKNMLL